MLQPSLDAFFVTMCFLKANHMTTLSPYYVWREEEVLQRVNYVNYFMYSYVTSY